MSRVARGILVGFLVAVTGCSLDYGKDQTAVADEVPQMVFEGIRQTAVKDGRILYTMESDSSEVFQAKKQVRLKNFRFQEYDSNGTESSRGSADSAMINTDTNDARITGRLSARSEEQAVTLEVDGGTRGGLRWNNADQILKTEPETGVTLRKDDGSKIEARSLTLDMGSNRLELEDGVQGTWTPETKQNAKTPPPPSSPGASPSAVSSP